MVAPPREELSRGKPPWGVFRRANGADISQVGNCRNSRRRRRMHTISLGLYRFVARARGTIVYYSEFLKLVGIDINHCGALELRIIKWVCDFVLKCAYLEWSIARESGHFHTILNCLLKVAKEATSLVTFRRI